MELEWSEWTKEEFPTTTCKVIDLAGSVQLCNVNEETGWGNREWKVVNRDGAVLGHGYTLGSINAMQLCAAVIHVWGYAVPPQETSRLGMSWQNPRRA